MGSGRSELKLRMRSNSIVSKHDDIFSTNSNNELIIEPLRDLDTPTKASAAEKNEMPPLPPHNQATSATKEKRRAKQRNGEPAVDDYTSNERRERKERKERRKNRSNSSANLKKSESTREITERQSQSKAETNSFLNSAYNSNNDEDEYMESLKRITSKHRLRRGSSAGGHDTDEIDKENNTEKQQQQQPKQRVKKGSTKSKKNRDLGDVKENTTTTTPTPRTLIGSKAIEEVNNKRDVSNDEFLGSSANASMQTKRNSVVKMNAFEMPAAETPRSQLTTARPVNESEAENNSDDVAVDFDNKEMTRVLNLIDDAYYKPIFDRFESKFLNFQKLEAIQKLEFLVFSV